MKMSDEAFIKSLKLLRTISLEMISQECFRLQIDVLLQKSRAWKKRLRRK